MIANGFCVDTTGKEAGRGFVIWGYTEDDCFKRCLEDPNFNGCTFSFFGSCITYTGDIKGGSGDVESKCYYRYGIVSFLFYVLKWSSLKHLNQSLPFIRFRNRRAENDHWEVAKPGEICRIGKGKCYKCNENRNSKSS